MAEVSGDLNFARKQYIMENFHRAVNSELLNISEEFISLTDSYPITTAEGQATYTLPTNVAVVKILQLDQPSVWKTKLVHIPPQTMEIKKKAILNGEVFSSDQPLFWTDHLRRNPYIEFQDSAYIDAGLSITLHYRYAFRVGSSAMDNAWDIPLDEKYYMLLVLGIERRLLRMMARGGDQDARSMIQVADADYQEAFRRAKRSNTGLQADQTDKTDHLIY